MKKLIILSLFLLEIHFFLQAQDTKLFKDSTLLKNNKEKNNKKYEFNAWKKIIIDTKSNLNSDKYSQNRHFFYQKLKKMG